MKTFCRIQKNAYLCRRNNNVIECVNLFNDNVHQEIHMISSKSNKMQNQDLIYRKQYMRQLQGLKDQNTIMCECANI